ncbi:MAG: TRAP transporter small permease [Desulfobacteraceae bacterium]|nr:MAG: TRAP transporter small permease [Desulfobacteraceae bacterium]
MRALQVLNEWFVKLGSWGTILFMAIIAVVIPYEVIGRYVFQKMSIWSGEVSTYSLAWASMMGGAVGLKKGYQIGMTSVVESVPPAVAKTLKLVSYLCTLFFFGAMFWYGLYQTVYNAKQTSPAIGLVMSYPYASLPVGFFMMFFISLEEFLAFLGLGGKGAEK